MGDTPFDLLPWHFHPGQPIFDEGISWVNVLPAYSDLPATFHSVLPFLLAALIKHRDFLQETLHHNHPLFSSAVWQSGLLHSPTMAARVHGGSHHNPTTGLTATGIPPYQELARSLEEVKTKLHQMHQESKETIDRAMGRITETIERELASAPERVKAMLKDEFQIQGLQPLGRGDVESMLTARLTELRESLLQAFRERGADPAAAAAAAAAPPPQAPPLAGADNGQELYPMHQWPSGRLSYAPVGFVFNR